MKLLVGSTEITPAVRPRARIRVTRAEMSVDLPTPGGPVTPIVCAWPVSGKSIPTSSRAAGSPSSTSEIARASARVSPARTPTARSAAVDNGSVTRSPAGPG